MRSRIPSLLLARRVERRVSYISTGTNLAGVSLAEFGPRIWLIVAAYGRRSSRAVTGASTTRGRFLVGIRGGKAERVLERNRRKRRSRGC